MEVSAEKAARPRKRTDAIIAPLPKIAFMLSGLLSDVDNKSSARCASLFFPKTRPPAQGVGNYVSRSWGLASLMHVLEKPQLAFKKKEQAKNPACSTLLVRSKRLAQGIRPLQGRRPPQKRDEPHFLAQILKYQELTEGKKGRNW